jgi:hypothetical protein
VCRTELKHFASKSFDWPKPSIVNFTPSTASITKSPSKSDHILDAMPICIECRYPVSALYTTYSKADDKALGKGVRLTQCPRCKRFADKYVEHDFVVLFIDLVLIKPQVGHIYFQQRGRSP